MNLTAAHSTFRNPFQRIANSNIRSNSVYGLIIILALAAFEALNFGTTNYALRDMLGDLKFMGIPWALLMTLAFCGVDFAGIARLITQTGKKEDQKESWYLFGAWLMAATFNAALTWWGVTIAISNHETVSAALVNTKSLTSVIPVVVAIMLWVIRILIIGSLTTALDKVSSRRKNRYADRSAGVTARPTPSVRTERPAPTYPNRPVPAAMPMMAKERREATYHNMSSDSNEGSKQIQLTRLKQPVSKF